MRHVRIIDAVPPSEHPSEAGSVRLKKSALVHLHCEARLSALDVSIRGTIGMLAVEVLQ